LQAPSWREKLQMLTIWHCGWKTMQSTFHVYFLNICPINLPPTLTQICNNHLDDCFRHNCFSSTNCKWRSKNK
jgi:hypothetical protein